MSRDEATLDDILAAAARIERFVAGLTLHELLVIGEASKRLSADFRDANLSIPWRQIAGMRDKLIHAYDAVDLGEVWRTASVDVPAVATVLRSRAPS